MSEAETSNLINMEAWKTETKLRREQKRQNIEKILRRFKEGLKKSIEDEIPKLEDFLKLSEFEQRLPQRIKEWKTTVDDIAKERKAWLTQFKYEDYDTTDQEPALQKAVKQAIEMITVGPFEDAQSMSYVATRNLRILLAKLNEFKIPMEKRAEALLEKIAARCEIVTAEDVANLRKRVDDSMLRVFDRNSYDSHILAVAVDGLTPEEKEFVLANPTEWGIHNLIGPMTLLKAVLKTDQHE